MPEEQRPVLSPPAEVFDPTKNVGDLVEAEGKKRDAFRVNDAALLDAKIETLRAEQRVLQAITEGQANLHTLMQDAENRRLEQLATLRDTYEKRIADMLAESARSTSSLVATQLVQIQSTFDARVSKLEEFRLLSTGRSSVADPALAASLEQMATAIAALTASGTSGAGRGAGHREVIGWIVAGLAMLGTLVIAYTSVRPPSIQPTTTYVPAPTAQPSTPAPVTVPR